MKNLAELGCKKSVPSYYCGAGNYFFGKVRPVYRGLRGLTLTT